MVYMKGAKAELWANTIKTPRTKRPTNMGTSHHLLALQKNDSNSPTVLKRLEAVLTAFEAPTVVPLTPSLPAVRELVTGSHLTMERINCS
jgi:hypothetical protein